MNFRIAPKANDASVNFA
jgi:hypothetical protein